MYGSRIRGVFFLSVIDCYATSLSFPFCLQIAMQSSKPRLWLLISNGRYVFHLLSKVSIANANGRLVHVEIYQKKHMAAILNSLLTHNICT